MLAVEVSHVVKAFGPEEALLDYIKQCTEHRQLLDYPIPDW